MIALSLIYAVASDPGAFQSKVPGDWWDTVKLKTSVSKEWEQEKAVVQKSVQFLKQDSAANRKKKLDQFSKKLTGYGLDPKIAYKAIVYSLEFSEDINGIRRGDLYSSAPMQAWAVHDPEFARVAYTATCQGMNARQWPGLGPKLIRIFPKDMQLKEAVMLHCVHTLVTYEDGLVGLALVNDAEKMGMPKLRVTARRANIHWMLYQSKKNKRDLDKSIGYFEQAIQLEKDPERLRIAESWLKRLKKVRDDLD